MKFKFELKQPVTIQSSGEQGVVKSRVEHVDQKNQYLVHYKAADGRAVEAYWFESDLKAIPAAAPKPKRVSKPTVKRVRRSKPAAPIVPTV
jgi:hypothetical protein